MNHGRALSTITYDCSYCGEPHNEWGELQVNKRGSYCSPECQLAQGLYFVYVNNETLARQHHESVELQAGRKVNPAPVPRKLRKYDLASGETRDQWLPKCRADCPGADVGRKK